MTTDQLRAEFEEFLSEQLYYGEGMQPRDLAFKAAVDFYHRGMLRAAELKLGANWQHNPNCDCLECNYREAIRAEAEKVKV